MPVPTLFGVYAAKANSTVWNPADKAASITLSNGNKTATMTAAHSQYDAVRTTTSKSSGKFYFEVLCNVGIISGIDDVIGFMNAASPITSAYPGSSANSVGVNNAGGFLGDAGGVSAQAFGSGDTLGVAVDVSAGGWWVAKIGGVGYNNGAGNPAAGTGASTFSVVGSLFIATGLFNNTQAFTLNTGGSFLGVAPAGFSAWG